MLEETYLKEREQKIAFTQQQLNLLQRNDAAGRFCYQTLEHLRTVIMQVNKLSKERWIKDSFVFTVANHTICSCCCKTDSVEIIVAGSSRHVYRYEIYDNINWQNIQSSIWKRYREVGKGQ